jgi:S-adenosylmethionine hydrolase
VTLPNGIVTLLTDFGLRDPYVGIMKGAMLKRARAVRLFDLSHEVTPHQTREAGFWLKRSVAWFPRGTVHLVVVDPGVGTERRAVAVATNDHYFVAPDNGVLSPALEGHAFEARCIDPAILGPIELSRTFHGRDLFGPVAACLATDQLQFTELGPTCQPIQVATGSTAPTGADELLAEVLSIDRFGNLITDAEQAWLQDYAPFEVVVAGTSLRVVETYGEAAPGECVALIGSHGTMEIACREASASEHLKIQRGARIKIRRLARAPR